MTRTSLMKPDRVDAAVALVNERHRREWNALPEAVRNAFRRWAAVYANVNPDASALDIAIAALARCGITARQDAASRLTIPAAAWDNAKE